MDHFILRFSNSEIEVELSKSSMDPNQQNSSKSESDKKQQTRKVICPKCGKLQYKHNLKAHMLSRNCREENSPALVKHEFDGKVRFC